MNSKVILIIIVAVVLLASGYFYFNTQSAPEVAAPQNMEEFQENIIEDDPTSLDESMGAVVFDMTGDNFSFDPSEINVQLGQTVRVVLFAEDIPHDFVIDELGVRSEIAQPGETVEIQFVATEIGEFEYYCSVGNHQEMGMIGTLTVTE